MESNNDKLKRLQEDYYGDVYILTHLQRDNTTVFNTSLNVQMPLNPKQWKLYMQIEQLKTSIEFMETQKLRCRNASQYLLGLVRQRTSNIESEESYRRCIIPFRYWCHQFRVGSYLLHSTPELAANLEQALSYRIFDSCPDFFASYVEIKEESNDETKLCFYFIY